MPLFLGEQYILGRTVPYDAEPIKDSKNLVTSGGIFNAIELVKKVDERQYLVLQDLENIGEKYIVEMRGGNLVSRLPITSLNGTGTEGYVFVLGTPPNKEEIHVYGLTKNNEIYEIPQDKVTFDEVIQHYLLDDGNEVIGIKVTYEDTLTTAEGYIDLFMADEALSDFEAQNTEEEPYTFTITEWLNKRGDDILRVPSNNLTIILGEEEGESNV